MVSSQALNDEYVIRCLTPSRSGRLRAQKGDLMPSIFKTKLRRSDPRAVNAMAKYAVASNLSFGTLGNSTTNNDAIKISSKKSARLLATAVYYALKQVCSCSHGFSFSPYRCGDTLTVLLLFLLHTDCLATLLATQ